MYGDDEFGAAAALEGLGAVPHVQAVMGIDPEAIVTVQAQAMTAAQATEEPAAQPGDAPLAQGAGDWPKATEIDPTRLQAARAIKDKVIKDDLDSSKLTGWQLASTKPRKAELHWLADSVARKAGMRPRRLRTESVQHPALAAPRWQQQAPVQQLWLGANPALAATAVCTELICLLHISTNCNIATAMQLFKSDFGTLCQHSSVGCDSHVICVCCDTSSSVSATRADNRMRM